jgi:hypothetical protein
MDMRTSRVVGLAMATVLTTVGVAAQAHASSWSFHSSYAHYEQCLIPGRAGVSNHSWLDFRCVTVIPDITGPGKIDLYILLP